MSRVRKSGWYWVKRRKTDPTWVVANWSEVEGVWRAIGYYLSLPDQVFAVVGNLIEPPKESGGSC